MRLHVRLRIAVRYEFKAVQLPYVGLEVKVIWNVNLALRYRYGFVLTAYWTQYHYAVGFAEIYEVSDADLWRN